MADVDTRSQEVPSAALPVAIAQARAKRAYRYAATQRLLALASLVSEDEAAAALTAMDRDSLDTLPHWCLLDSAPLQALQRTAGAVFAAPALHQCIDGARLQQWRQHLGDQLFESLMRVSEAQSFGPCSMSLPDVEEAWLLETGASVLQSTVAEHPARVLLATLTGDTAQKLPFAQAQQIYLLASSMVDSAEQAQPQGSAAQPDALSEPQGSSAPIPVSAA